MTRPKIQKLDLFVIFALLAVAICWLWKPISASNDLWWHLATGRYMVETKTLPLRDVFSWTMSGHDWINHEWLFDALSFKVFHMGGLSALIGLKIVLIVSALSFMALSLHRARVPALLSGAALLLAFWASRYGWNVRADLVTLLFTSALCFSLRQYKRQGRLRALALWPLVFLLWANLHGGFILGLAVLGAYSIGTFIEQRKAPLVALWGVCAFATCLNPWGWRMHHSIFEAMGLLQTGDISEWMRTPWHPLQLFWMCAVGYGLVWVRHLISAKRLNWPEFLVGILLSFGAIRYVRNVPVFMMGAFPFAVIELAEHFPGRALLEKPFLKVVTLMFCIAAIALLGPRMAGGVDQRSYPIEACRFILDEKLPPRFYNDYAFGGYWMWHFGPERPVFIDGRYHAVEGYPALFASLEQARGRDPETWQAYLTHWGVEAALVGYAKSETYPSVGHFYFPRATWALVYWDDTAMIYVRRSSKTSQLIRQWEFSTVNPDVQEGFFQQWLLHHPHEILPLQNELRRNLHLHPDSLRTQRLLKLIQTLNVVS